MVCHALRAMECLLRSGGRNVILGRSWASCLLLLCIASHALWAGEWAQYRIISVDENYTFPVASLRITVSSDVDEAHPTAVWWEMVGEKTDGQSYTVRVLSDRVPMMHRDGSIGEVYRYIFRQEDTTAIEYIDSHANKPLLPRYDFYEALLPIPFDQSARDGKWLSSGDYLGQAITLVAAGTDAELSDIGPITPIAYDTDLLFGPICGIREVDEKRLSDGKYTFRPTTPQEWEEMVAVGYNITRLINSSDKWLWDKPVFFHRELLGDAPFPEAFYRSNYLGVWMFVDEPAVLVHSVDGAMTPEDAGNVLRKRTFTYHKHPTSYPKWIMSGLANFNIKTGAWAPMDGDVPTWETYHELAFYEMEGGSIGVIHEGRYRLQDYRQWTANLLGSQVELTPTELLVLHYAFLRGAARCFDGDWGTSIYGQAEPELGELAVKLAYDMGAHWIFTGTGGMEHHTPYKEQIALAKALREHQQLHPRPDRRSLVRQATVAVALPYGYDLDFFSMWRNNRFRLDKKNASGARYGDVLAAAFWQGVFLARKGIAFDFVIDTPQVEKAGYEQIVRVDTLGRVHNAVDGVSSLPEPVVTIQQHNALQAESPAEGAPITTVPYVRPGQITVDGSLEDWPTNSSWISLDEEARYGDRTRGGAADLSAWAALAYDSDALLVAIKVNDDQHFQERTEENPTFDTSLWQQDSVLLAFDPYADRMNDGYAVDDIELVLALTKNGPVIQRWEGMLSGEQGLLANAQVAIVRKDATTTYEARIPFSDLRPMHPAWMKGVGMNIAVNDSDGTPKRRGALQWRFGVAEGRSPASFGWMDFGQHPARAFNGSTAEPVFRPIRTVTTAGTSAQWLLATLRQVKADAELSIELSCAPGMAKVTRNRVHLPKGASVHSIGIDTSKLSPGNYDVRFSLRTDAEEITSNQKLYILP